MQWFRGGLVFETDRLLGAVSRTVVLAMEALLAAKRWLAVMVLGYVIRNVQRFRGGLVFKAHRLLYHSRLIDFCVSLNSGLESNKERERALLVAKRWLAISVLGHVTLQKCEAVPRRARI